MRNRYHPWAKPYIDEHQEICISVGEIGKLKNIYLEIGAGKGAFMLKMSQKHLDKTYIAVEKDVSCAGFIAKSLVEDEIKNAKLFLGDASVFLDGLKDESVDILFLNFSDPWPKKRHSKRRLTHTLIIEKYLRVLKPKGLIRFKSDNDDLYEYSKESFNNPHLKLLVDEFDYDGSDEFDEMSEYEIKKRKLLLKIHRLILEKND